MATRGAGTTAPLADALTAVGLIGLGVGFLRGALRIPSASALWTWYDNPGLTPALLAMALLFQAAILLVRSLRRARQVGLGWDLDKVHAWGVGRVGGALALCVAFVGLMGRVPFSLLVFAFVFGMTVAFRGADPLRAGVLAVLSAVAVVVVFGQLFFIPLP
ncbi:MAG: tripartite tricarboxylate transporter TctB family protein [Armatimonadota bacterium]|nr:tripartite tricarboxylate transporter TctB family protein [Armatimonadota bacterium]MDW8155632.1 tripartite tricarboxylate transporter TctB family protein [Armatimonadota bacterium]